MSTSEQFVLSRRCRATKTTVELWKNMDDFPWYTICVEHAGCVGHTNRKDAVAWMSHPDEWCPTCQGDSGPTEEF